MKDQFLKLAGAKNEKEFYKLFPTEEAFMAKYGKQVKKLQFGKHCQSLLEAMHLQLVYNLSVMLLEEFNK